MMTSRIGVGSVVKTEYEFNPGQSGDLSLSVQDVVLIQRLVDDQWASGLNLFTGQEGVFPLNHINVLQLPSGYTVAFAHAHFPASQYGDLELRKGDVVVINKQIDSEWSEGNAVDGCSGKVTSQRGIFPASFVVLLHKDVSHTSEPTKRMGLVKYELNAKIPEEMSAAAGQQIYITGEPDNMYYSACSMDSSTSGLVPKGFIQIIHTPMPGQSSPRTSQPYLYLPSQPSPIPRQLSPIPSQPPPIPRQLSPTPSQPSPTPSQPSPTPSQPSPTPSTPPAYPPPALPKTIAQSNSDNDVTPYGRAKYSFNAECKGEISVDKDEIVQLLRHIDKEWTLVLCGGRKGLVPTDYVDIIVDCLPTINDSDSGYLSSDHSNFDTKHSISKFEVSSLYRVQYTFNGPEPGDLNVTQGDVIRVTEIPSPDWLIAVKEEGTGYPGLIPCSFVDSQKIVKPVSSRNNKAWTERNRFSLDETIAQNVVSLDLRGLESKKSTFAATKPFNSQNGPQKAPYASLSIQSLDVTNSTKKIAPPRPSVSPAVKQVKQPSPDELRANEERRRLELVESNKLQWQKIAEDLLRQEKDFYRDLTVIQKVVNGHSSALDTDVLLRGVPEVMHLSARIVKLLQNELVKDYDNQNIGAVFVNNVDAFAQVYTDFFDWNEEAMTLLVKYESQKWSQFTLRKCLESMKDEGCSCIDMHSALSRPISRLLKYPLFLDMLYKVTANGHTYKGCLGQALQVMTDLAQSINENKRKKDLVVKYRSGHGQSLSGRISKLTMHSVRKKTSRFSVRLSSSIGLANIVRDMAFDEAHRQFIQLELSLDEVMRQVHLYSDHLQHYIATGSDMAHLWDDMFTTCIKDVNKPHLLQIYVQAYTNIAQNLLPRLFESLQSRTRNPLESLQRAFCGPSKLITKREDKLLDLESATSRSKSVANESTKKSLALEHERIARGEYEALNSQLLGDLPKLTLIGHEIFNQSVASYIALHNQFAKDMRKAFAPLEGLAASADTIEASFEARHRRVWSGLCQLTVVKVAPLPAVRKRSKSPTSKSLTGSGRGSSRFKSYLKMEEDERVTFPERKQTQEDRDTLRSKGNDVYVVLQSHHATDDNLELNVNKGDHVLALIKKDPLGNNKRWYVDKGNSQGFLPSSLLQKLAIAQEGAFSSLGQTSGVKQWKLMRANSDIPLIDLNPDLPPTPHQPLPLTTMFPSPVLPLRPTYDNIGYEDPPQRVLTPRRAAPMPPQKGELANPQNQRLSSVVENEVEFYVALFDYNASDENEIDITQGQILALHSKHDLEGNADWWLVEDEYESVGYVPANYITPVTR